MLEVKASLGANFKTIIAYIIEFVEKSNGLKINKNTNLDFTIGHVDTTNQDQKSTIFNAINACRRDLESISNSIGNNLIIDKDGNVIVSIDVSDVEFYFNGVDGLLVNNKMFITYTIDSGFFSLIVGKVQSDNFEPTTIDISEYCSNTWTPIFYI